MPADGIDVVRNTGADISALGVAYLAGIQLGIWKSLEEVEALPRSLDRFEPAVDSAQREDLYRGWRHAISRTLHKPEATTNGPEGRE